MYCSQWTFIVINIRITSIIFFILIMPPQPVVIRAINLALPFCRNKKNSEQNDHHNQQVALRRYARSSSAFRQANEFFLIIRWRGF